MRLVCTPVNAPSYQVLNELVLQHHEKILEKSQQLNWTKNTPDIMPLKLLTKKFQGYDSLIMKLSELSSLQLLHVHKQLCATYSYTLLTQIPCSEESENYQK